MMSRMSIPVLEITSHIDGKNAKVRVYVDRVEWERGKHVSGAKVTAAVMTGGLSLAATGVRTRKDAGVEMIPMRSISSVVQKHDTVLNDVVSIITSGNSIDMRCSRAEAGQLRQVIMAGINGQLVEPTPPAPQAAWTPPSPAPTGPPVPAAPPAGWYPDQQNPALVRWWDGTRWTEHTNPR